MPKTYKNFCARNSQNSEGKKGEQCTSIQNENTHKTNSKIRISQFEMNIQTTKNSINTKAQKNALDL
jgi:hypothetical protein